MNRLEIAATCLFVAATSIFLLACNWERLTPKPPPRFKLGDRPIREKAAHDARVFGVINLCGVLATVAGAVFAATYRSSP